MPPYRWRNTPGWRPEEAVARARTPDPNPRARPMAAILASRKERVARYRELRDSGMTKEEAAAEIFLARTTAKTYEKEYRERGKAS